MFSAWEFQIQLTGYELKEREGRTFVVKTAEVFGRLFTRRNLSEGYESRECRVDHEADCGCHLQALLLRRLTTNTKHSSLKTNKPRVTIRHNSTLKKEKSYRISLILLTLLQIGLSALYLNSLSRIENWSAVYAEDSRGYLLVADYFQGREIPADELPLMRYRLFSPLVPLAASLLGSLTGTPAAFLIINILLWLITALLFYEFLNSVLADSFFCLCRSSDLHRFPANA